VNRANFYLFFLYVLYYLLGYKVGNVYFFGMLINDKTSFRKSTEGTPSEMESIMAKKTTAKKVVKKSEISLIADLRKDNPIKSSGLMESACISYLMANIGKAFTSYEIHSVVGGNTAKSVRDCFRSLGLKKANLSENKGVIRYLPNPKYAVVMGKQGAKVTYRMEKVQVNG